MHDNKQSYNSNGKAWITFQDKEEWLKIRKNSIGASEVAAARGISKYKTRYELFLDKLNDSIDYADNESMYWGRMHENSVAIRFSEETGLKVRKENKIRIHSEYPFLSATLDRTIVADPETAYRLFVVRFPDIDPDIFKKPGILEIKTVRGYAYDKWDAEIAPEYWCQIQHQFDVTGYEWGFFAILIDGNRYIQYPVIPDQKFIKIQRQDLIDFWNEHIIPEVAPEMDVKDYEKLPLKEDKVKRIEDPAEQDRLLHRYERYWIVSKMIKSLEEEKSQLQDELKLAIKDYKKLIVAGNELCNYTEYINFDSTAFKKENEALYEKYKTKIVRRFNVKGL